VRERQGTERYVKIHGALMFHENHQAVVEDEGKVILPVRDEENIFQGGDGEVGVQAP
jgi:hypothetical protein